MMRRWISGYRALLLRGSSQRAAGTEQARPAADATAPPSRSATGVEGTAQGWIRVLDAKALLAQLHAQSALDATWRQSRLAASVWEHDLLGSIHRFADYVQLMPASESHHHAHAGGLLAHTLEMVLAAVTWRNGHFLPSGAQIEQIDAERDVWTYVVFYAALLHDIAKPLTDLRIQWRAAGMSENLRWTPVAGNLVQLTQGRAQAEYRVEFTPKSLRDYGAHSKLALTLLGQIAPPSALAFLAGTPQAMDALTQYLSGQDKTSLVARIVSRADQASTAKALMTGSRARFDTACSVPLIELLMGAIRAMLANGTALPLNRSGAAGWVHDGSVWFVAKRLADAVRTWLRKHAPEESIPGDSKNDRLFDTWQEYGCIQPNPHTGQAVWYVVVQGNAGAPQGEGGAAADEGAGYSHQLTMLRFPLARLYEDEARYPPVMTGRIEVKDKRPKEDPSAQAGADEAVATTSLEPVPRFLEPETEAEPTTPQEAATAAPIQGKKPAAAAGTQLRAPAFNKPKAGAAPAGKNSKHAAEPVQRQAAPAASKPSRTVPVGEITVGGGVDGFDADDGLLGDDDDVRQLPDKHKTAHAAEAAAKAQEPAPGTPRERQAAAPEASQHQTAAMASTPVRAKTHLVQPMFGPAEPGPVLLAPQLPELPQETAARKTEPSATALAFMQWLQQGLANRQIKYNEAGAPVHFTSEGMALVSPLIFKLYASETGPQADADTDGLQVQREVIKAGWHRMTSAQGSGRLNILRYAVLGRGAVAVGKISAVVLTEPDRWVMPVPPANPVLQLA
ncbi:MobH family relaxase [Diaphorobacter sp. C33]|uniref:Integrating conjugative element relaxase (TIGR03760 family) n=1 Tax=Diaphorobacter nitroreducens TaxID=164759 RepID=A0AAX1WQY7_9BURK|nr:MobH family relaxase [Diaphorobacter sp. C33]ROR39690.1 integrating conjugative element relaxase (TIGR03760 family) [Diaphorobacter nitroreducens]WKK90590.1 MobH family relaxase [Diaphorobacter sp. C33]